MREVTNREVVGPFCPIYYEAGKARPYRGDEGPIVEMFVEGEDYSDVLDYDESSYDLEPVRTSDGVIFAYVLKDPHGKTIADYSASKIKTAVARLRRLNRKWAYRESLK